MEFETREDMRFRQFKRLERRVEATELNMILYGLAWMVFVTLLFFHVVGAI